MEATPSLLGNDHKIKKSDIFVGGSNTYFLISIIAIVVAVIAWCGLWFWNGRIEKSIGSMKSQISSFDSSRDTETESKIISFNNQLNSAQTLLDDHVVLSRALSKFYSFIQPKVQLNKLDISVEQKVISISGIADSYVTVAKQLVSFELYDAVESIGIGTISEESDGNVSFDMTINLDQTKLLLKNFEAE